MLTETQIDELNRLGYTKTRMCAEADALEMQDLVWARLEKYDVRRDDPSTWRDVHAGGLSKTVRRQRIFRDAVSDAFLREIDQLLGPGEWDRPGDWGMVLYTFPETNGRPWDVSRGNWHWHLNPLRNVERLKDLFCFSFLSDVAPEGGGTLVLEGVHHVTRKYLAEMTPEERGRKAKVIRENFYRYHPWLKELARKDDEGSRRHLMELTDVHGFPCRVAELTGKPGEAVITLAGVLHCRSRNCLDRPRFMRAVPIRRRGYGRGLEPDSDD